MDTHFDNLKKIEMDQVKDRVELNNQDKSIENLTKEFAKCQQDHADLQQFKATTNIHSEILKKIDMDLSKHNAESQNQDKCMQNLSKAQSKTNQTLEELAVACVEHKNA